jgi:hypothetical protein
MSQKGKENFPIKTVFLTLLPKVEPLLGSEGVPNTALEE